MKTVGINLQMPKLPNRITNEDYEVCTCIVCHRNREISLGTFKYNHRPEKSVCVWGGGGGGGGCVSWLLYEKCKNFFFGGGEACYYVILHFYTFVGEQITV